MILFLVCFLLNMLVLQVQNAEKITKILLMATGQVRPSFQNPLTLSLKIGWFEKHITICDCLNNRIHPFYILIPDSNDMCCSFGRDKVRTIVIIVAYQ